MNTWTIGQPVRIVDEFNGHDVPVCTGNVVRLTKAQVVVVNQHGNETKFWKKNNQVVGYAWPQVCTALRPMEDK